MNPTDLYRNKIGDRLTRRIAQAFTDGEITREELSEISTYVLENIDKATSNSELLQFLEDSALKWPFLSGLASGEKSEAVVNQEQQAVSQISTLLNENKIEDALQVAKNATDNQNQGGQA